MTDSQARAAFEAFGNMRWGQRWQDFTPRHTVELAQDAFTAGRASMEGEVEEVTLLLREVLHKNYQSQCIRGGDAAWERAEAFLNEAK